MPGADPPQTPAQQRGPNSGASGWAAAAPFVPGGQEPLHAQQPPNGRLHATGSVQQPGQQRAPDGGVSGWAAAAPFVPGSQGPLQAQQPPTAWPYAVGTQHRPGQQHEPYGASSGWVAATPSVQGRGQQWVGAPGQAADGWGHAAGSQQPPAQPYGPAEPSGGWAGATPAALPQQRSGTPGQAPGGWPQGAPGAELQVQPAWHQARAGLDLPPPKWSGPTVTVPGQVDHAPHGHANGGGERGWENQGKGRVSGGDLSEASGWREAGEAGTPPERGERIREGFRPYCSPPAFAGHHASLVSFRCLSPKLVGKSVWTQLACVSGIACCGTCETGLGAAACLSWLIHQLALHGGSVRLNSYSQFADGCHKCLASFIPSELQE